MQATTLILGLSALAFHSVNAAPTQTSEEPALAQRRQLLSGLEGAVGELLGSDGLLTDVLSTVDQAAQGKLDSPISSILGGLTSIAPAATQTDISQASATLSSICNASPTPTNIYAEIAQLAASGLTADNLGTLLDYVEGGVSAEDSSNNRNTRQPSITVYPKASSQDAPYDISEDVLRSAIYIPPTFQYGRAGAPQPIILFPGTGATGYTTFKGNYIPLLQGSKIADPVWVNVPHFLLDDAQANAEFAAYAINYIYGISNRRKIAVAAWSQGNINCQWAYKYWPSTRTKVTDQIAFSPDYHGTVLANLIAFPGEPLPPSVLQQEYNSNFITTLRNNNGDSAYVPTTTVYSGFFDEIVEPQQGTGASAFINNVRNVGASNSEVQVVCNGQPGGTFYTHEGILANPLGFALLKDALAHDGPGQTSRLNLASVCSTYLSPGLNLADFLITENNIPIAGLAILTYPTPVAQEPTIKSK